MTNRKIWDDERVGLLKKLWAEGLSASKIAARLGEVTRNAVIGKVHRLGLSGRVTTSRFKSRAKGMPKKAPVPNAAERERIAAQKRAAEELLRRRAVLQKASVQITEPAPQPLPEPEPEPLPTPPPVVLGVALLDLKESMCRFPNGDPQDKDFHFCGERKADGLPYCEKHARIAFQAIRRRPKTTTAVNVTPNRLFCNSIAAE